jgi:hypothetical protein
MKRGEEGDAPAGGNQDGMLNAAFHRQETEIRAAVWRRYEVELARAGILKRLLLRLRIGREIKSELRRFAPERAFDGGEG